MGANMSIRLVRSCCLAAVLLWQVSSFAQQPPSVSDAVHKGHAVGHEQDGIDAVRAALAARGNVNERDESGWTPLMHAALECRARIMTLLLDRGADPKIHAKSSRTTTYMDHGQTALVVASGCFIARRRAELAPERGMSASYIESERAAPLAMVRALTGHGAEVNAADADGKTPLMMAAMQGWTGVVAELLSRKAAVNARDQEGRRAIDYADPKATEVIGLLQKGGSQPPGGRSGRTACDAERALGFPIIDCIAGSQVSAMILKFQKDRSLPPTGELDAPTRNALGIR